MSGIEIEDEQLKKEMEQAGELANTLIKQNPPFLKAVSGMLASRQLYAVCAYELESLLKDMEFPAHVEAEEADRQRGMVRELLINSAAVQGQQPFDERQLFEGLTKTVFPWLESLVEKHTAQQAAQRKKVEEAREQLRITSQIDIGVPVLPDGGSVLGRQSRVIFVGKPNVLRFLAAQIIDHVLAVIDTQHQVVHLAEQRHEPAQPTSYLATVPNMLWANCASATTKFHRLYEAAILPQINQTPDVLLVDDLRKANTGLLGKPETLSLANVNEAQHRLAKWTEAAAALLISFLPLERELTEEELASSAYASLIQHNLVHKVEARPTDGTRFDVCVGETPVAATDAETLAKYTTLRIITQ